MAINKEKVTKSAEKHIKAGRLENAISEYLSLLKENPKDWQVRNQVGDLYARLGKVREAVHHWTEMAEFYAQDGFNLKAIAMYTKVKRIDPHNMTVLMKLAELNSKQGLINDARNQFLEVAEFYQRQSKIDETLEIYRRIVDLDRDNLKMRIKLAELYAKERMVAPAVEEFSRVAEEYRRRNQIDECVEILNQALNLDRRNTQAILTLAQVQLDQGQRAAALRLVDDALLADPHDARLLRFLGELYQKADDFTKAEHYYRRLVEVDPNASDTLLGLGQRLLKRNDPDRAFALFEPVVSLLVKQREGEKAVGLLRSILNVSSGHIQTLRKLVDVYSTFKQRSNLIAALSTLSDSLHARGHTQEALSVIERVIDLDPENYQHRERLIRFKGEKDAPGYQVPVAETAQRASPPPSAPVPAATARETRIAEEPPAPPPPKPSSALIEADEGTPAQLLELLTEADVFMRYKLFDKAQEQLLHALRLDPKSLRAHAHLKDIFEEKGLVGDAVQECVVLSEIYEDKGDIDAARSVLEEATTLDPNDVALLNRMRSLEEGVRTGVPVRPPVAPAAPPKPSPPPTRPAVPTPAPPARVEEEELEIDIGSLEEFEEAAGEQAEIDVTQPPAADAKAAAPPPAAEEAEEIEGPEVEIPDIDLDFVTFEDEAAPPLPPPAPPAVPSVEREAPPQQLIEIRQAEDRRPTPPPSPPPRVPPPVVEVPTSPQLLFGEELAPELADLRAEVERFNIELQEEPSSAKAPPPVSAGPAAPPKKSPPVDAKAPSAAKTTSRFADLEKEIEMLRVVEQPTKKAPPPIAPSSAAPPTGRAGEKKKTTLDELLMEDVTELEAIAHETAERPGEKLAAASSTSLKIPEEEGPSDLISTLDEIEFVEEGVPAAPAEAEMLGEGPLAPGLEEVLSEAAPASQAAPAVTPEAAEEEEEAGELTLDLEHKVEITAVSPPPAAEPATMAAERAGGEAGEGYFDLSSELEAELMKAEAVRSAASSEDGEIITDESQSYQEKSLEELFTEFRQGIEKQLGDEDYDTRYNLGIAYKEMGLIDEAIGEFQTAARDPQRILECCSLLGLCFMEKGMPKQAVQWLKRGLETPGHREEEYQGLRYDLGLAYRQVGDYGKAMDAFKDVFGFNANYRAVGERIRETESLLARSKGK